jgi:hypothetical protein
VKTSVAISTGALWNSVLPMIMYKGQIMHPIVQFGYPSDNSKKLSETLVIFMVTMEDKLLLVLPVGH